MRIMTAGSNNIYSMQFTGLDQGDIIAMNPYFYCMIIEHLVVKDKVEHFTCFILFSPHANLPIVIIVPYF